MKKKLTIFDADFLLYSATMGNKCLDDEGNPIKIDNKFTYTPKLEQEVYDCADSMIEVILDKTDASYYCGYLGGCKSFRYTIYPEYKGNRVNREMPLFYNQLKQHLINKWNFELTLDGLEADDAVNIARNNLKDEYECTLASSDKDLIKSIAGNYINVKNLELVTTTTEEAKKFFWTSMITGDVADNIKGLVGRGQKYADTLFSRENTLYYDDVMWAYIKQYGELQGIEEFYKNYKCLYILDKFRNFVTPTLSEWSFLRTYTEELGEI